ncbi:exonuclease [Chryseomicrobium excrementi]|uniref:Exonuclease n=1 Tax=Chryseomicrobium excrementi TaxID=2041346 RepID=A0A2M9F2Q0_9BACL|nr:ribonuclease H-like domain-containing protein [Chryseomicrobium excrementi]PJK17737.1 exonuclease [Chryseomicrobium excrementi]
MSYEKKLMAMKGLLKKQPEQIKEAQAVDQKKLLPNQWESSGYERVETPEGLYFKVTTHYPLDFEHGLVKFSELDKLLLQAKEKFPGHPLVPHDDKRVLFYDTETTGLKGVGVHIFLNGIIQRFPTHFQLDQYLLASPEFEVPFLKALPFQLADTIVTYNGKSFDIPQLEVRWTMNRKELPPFPTLFQVDLFHGSKRLWKGLQERYKLQDMEREQLAFVREEDMPGHLAPIIYMDALRSNTTENLDRVLEHNKWDLLSLVALYIRSLQHLLDQSEQSNSAIEINLAKWLKDIKLLPHSKELYEKVTERYERQDIPHAYYYLSLLKKREKEYEESFELMKIASDELQGIERLDALLYCAKILEHQLKDFNLATNYVLQAKAQLLTLTAVLTREKLADYLLDLKKRDARISRKIISRESADFDK